MQIEESLRTKVQQNENLTKLGYDQLGSLILGILGKPKT